MKITFALLSLSISMSLQSNPPDILHAAQLLTKLATVNMNYLLPTNPRVRHKHHQIQRQLIKCDQCDKKVQSGSAFSQHQKTHIPRFRHQCLCGKSYLNPMLLINHQLRIGKQDPCGLTLVTSQK